MKKLILLYTMILFLFGACSDEDTLTPTGIKNWFEIVEKENMDVVDQKIYDIYKKFGVGIFYNDTLGREDRGRRDSVGNVMYYYEVLNLSFDMTGSMGSVIWTRVDVSSLENKKQLLPLLDFLDATLLPFAKESNISIPAVMITATYRVANNDRNVYRGFNYLGISMANFSEDPDDKRTYLADFISQTSASKIENSLDEYYAIAEAEFKHLTPTPWNIQYTGHSRTLCPEFFNWVNPMYCLETYDEEYPAWKEEKEKYDAMIEAGEELTAEEQTAYSTATWWVGEYEDAKANEEEVRINYDLYCPEAHGIIELTGYYMVPSKAGDLASYMSAVFTYSVEEFRVLYAKFPLVIERFVLLREILEEAGFDVDGVRESM